jgi:hypothetical protein
MRIGLGRRQLIVSVIDACREWSAAYPMAVDASDRELARLSPNRDAMLERARSDAAAIMYGMAHLR